MKQWILATALLVSGCSAFAETCTYSPPQPTSLPASAISSPRLVLTGPMNLEIGLMQAPQTLAHGSDLLIAKYANGEVLSHRELKAAEFRADATSVLPLPAYVRLLFLQEAEGATEQDRQEAALQRDALRLGCSDVAHYRLDRLDVFSYAQTRSGGERYHAYFILSDGVVHYLDVVGTDDFAKAIISTLKKRT